jgi:glucose-1-phosphate thymidylyltransferase
LAEKRWITSKQVIDLAKPLMKNWYGGYLMNVIEEVKSKKLK